MLDPQSEQRSGVDERESPRLLCTSFPADTVFHQAVHLDRYDAIVCIYHDLKLLAFDSGVNVTLGLPIIRTSVDHGTAFDTAWTGQASRSRWTTPWPTPASWSAPDAASAG